MVSTIPRRLRLCASASTLRILYSPPEETKSEAKADDGIQTFSIYSDTSVRIKLGVAAENHRALRSVEYYATDSTLGDRFAVVLDGHPVGCRRVQ